MDDEIIKEVRKAKAKLAEKIGGEGFSNYYDYFQNMRKKLEAEGFNFIDDPKQIYKV